MRASVTPRQAAAVNVQSIATSTARDVRAPDRASIRNPRRCMQEAATSSRRCGVAVRRVGEHHVLASGELETRREAEVQRGLRGDAQQPGAGLAAAGVRPRACRVVVPLGLIAAPHAGAVPGLVTNTSVTTSCCGRPAP